jgi:hypothetical protein
MHIAFSDKPPVFDGSQMVVRFEADVNGVPVACAVSAEALEDHFGARSTLEADLLHAYEKGRTRVRSVCELALRQSGGAAVILRSGLFRIESA